MRALATSRAPLRLAGDGVRARLSTLPDAIELFQERASLLGRDGSTQPLARETAEEICERLDRLPLAIELAAARLRTLSPDRLLARLERLLPLLTGGPRDAPERQRTLRATLDWSYQLLLPPERHALAGLGVFMGGCTLEAAEFVCEADFDALEALVEQSLLGYRDSRYSLLESVREYALDQIRSTQELEQVRMRHADWALHLLEKVDPRDGRQFRPMFICELGQTEIANLREAIQLLIERRPDERAPRALAVGWIWEYGLRWREGIELVEAIGNAGPADAAAVTARSQASLAFLKLHAGDLDASGECAARGIDAAERAGDASALTVALLARTYLAHNRGEPEAGAWGEKALSVARERNEPLFVSRCLEVLGTVVASCDPGRAGRYYEEAVLLAREHGDRLAEGYIAFDLALLALREQRYEEAEARTLALLQMPLDDSLTRASATRGLGMALAGMRASGDAARLIGAADAEMERLGVFEERSETEPRYAALARIEASIGAAELQDALRQGGRLQIAEAVSFALSLYPSEG